MRAKPAKILEHPLFAFLKEEGCSQHILSSLAPISIRFFALRTLQCVVGEKCR